MTTMTIDQLKAAAYDSIAALEFHQKRLIEINKAIGEAAKSPVEDKKEEIKPTEEG